MISIEKLQKEVEDIKARNKRVSADKAWETSGMRKSVIFLLTYIVIVIFFFAAKLPDPFANAVVPSVAFVLSTLTVPLFRKWWINKFYMQRSVIEQTNAIIWRKNNDRLEFLLVQERDGMWSLPGGARDSADKSLPDAMKRELLEELGMKERDFALQATDIKISFLYDRPGSSRYGKTGLIYLFLVQSKSDATMAITTDVQKMQWFSPEEAKKMFSFKHHSELVDRAVKLLSNF